MPTEMPTLPQPRRDPEQDTHFLIAATEHRVDQKTQSLSARCVPLLQLLLGHAKQESPHVQRITSLQGVLNDSIEQSRRAAEKVRRLRHESESGSNRNRVQTSRRELRRSEQIARVAIRRTEVCIASISAEISGGERAERALQSVMARLERADSKRGRLRKQGYLLRLLPFALRAVFFVALAAVTFAIDRASAILGGLGPTTRAQENLHDVALLVLFAVQATMLDPIFHRCRRLLYVVLFHHVSRRSGALFRSVDEMESDFDALKLEIEEVCDIREAP